MFVSKEENKQKEAGNGPINIKNKNKAIAQWIRSCLRSCGPGFKSQAQQCHGTSFSVDKYNDGIRTELKIKVAEDKQK